MNPKHIARHLRMLAQICNALSLDGQHTAKSLAFFAGCHARTVQRYIEFLRHEMGAPIVWDSREGSYRLAKRWAFARALVRFVSVAP